MLCDLVIWGCQSFKLGQFLKAFGYLLGHIAGNDLLLERFHLQFIFAQQGKIAVIRQAHPLQKGVDPVAAGGLLAVFQPGEGHGFADAIRAAPGSDPDPAASA